MNNTIHKLKNARKNIYNFVMHSEYQNVFTNSGKDIFLGNNIIS